MFRFHLYFWFADVGFRFQVVVFTLLDFRFSFGCLDFGFPKFKLLYFVFLNLKFSMSIILLGSFSLDGFIAEILSLIDLLEALAKSYSLSDWEVCF